MSDNKFLSKLENGSVSFTVSLSNFFEDHEDRIKKLEKLLSPVEPSIVQFTRADLDAAVDVETARCAAEARGVAAKVYEKGTPGYGACLFVAETIEGDAEPVVDPNLTPGIHFLKYSKLDLDAAVGLAVKAERERINVAACKVQWYGSDNKVSRGGQVVDLLELQSIIDDESSI